MKTNEAPEKIYVYLSDRAGEDFDNEWGIMPLGEDSIEYTRTDAFIEKALDWIEKNIKDYIIVDIDKKYYGIDGLFFEDFRNYMKGE